MHYYLFTNSKCYFCITWTLPWVLHMYTNFLFDISMQISKSTLSPFPNQITAFLSKTVFLLAVHVLSMKLSISVSQNQESSLTLYTLSHLINKLLFEYVSSPSILVYLYYCHLLSYLVLPGSTLAALDLLSVFTLHIRWIFQHKSWSWYCSPLFRKFSGVLLFLDKN